MHCLLVGSVTELSWAIEPSPTFSEQFPVDCVAAFGVYDLYHLTHVADMVGFQRVWVEVCC